MALPQNVPTAQVELDRPRTIAFTLAAMRRAKELIGYSITQGVEPEDIGRVVWAMLVGQDREDLTCEDVEEMIHPGNMEAVGQTITQLQGGSVPEPKGEAGKPKGSRAKK